MEPHPIGCSTYYEPQASLAQSFPRTTKHYWDLVPFVRLSGTGKFKYGRDVLRIWEPGQFGPDPRHSQWWKRFSPWHSQAQNPRHGHRVDQEAAAPVTI